MTISESELQQAAPRGKLKAIPDSRKSRKRKSFNWPMLAFLLYAAGVVCYFGWVATDRFVSRSQFVVTRGSDASRSGGSLDSMLGGGRSHQDAYTAINYIHSMDVLRYLKDAGFDLRKHYSNSGLDLLNKLPEDASEQDLHKYLKKRIRASFDEVEGIVEVEVQAFDPESALNLAVALVDQTGKYLNDTNRFIAEERMKFILDELTETEEKLEDARQNLINFQNKNLIIDPETESRARLELIHELKKQKVLLRAKIIDLNRRSPQSPAISEYMSEVEALEQEIARESKTLTGEGPDQMNQLTSEFAKLTQSLEFATKRYEQSIAVAEEIRIQTTQAHRFLSVIETPFLPEEAAYPRRVYMSFSMLLVGLLGIQLINLLVRSILEHRS